MIKALVSFNLPEGTNSDDFLDNLIKAGFNDAVSSLYFNYKGDEKKMFNYIKNKERK